MSKCIATIRQLKKGKQSNVYYIVRFSCADFICDLSFILVLLDINIFQILFLCVDLCVCMCLLVCVCVRVEGVEWGDLSN